jgi:hypothetical protein
MLQVASSTWTTNMLRLDPAFNAGQDQGGFKGDSMSSLLYIYGLRIYIHGAFPATYSASSVKIWYPPRAVREKENERDKGREMEWRGVESKSSYRFDHLARGGSRV